MQNVDLFQMSFQWFCERLGQHGDAIFLSLAIAYQDLPIFIVDILDAQSDALHQSQAGAVEQARHEPVLAVDVGQHCPYLSAGEDHRQAFWLLRPFHLSQPAYLPVKNFAV